MSSKKQSPINIFIPILVILSLLTDWYVYQGIKPLTDWTQTYGEIWRLGWWLLSGGILGLLVYLLPEVFRVRKLSPVFTIVLNAFITLFVTKLVFIVILLGDDVFRTAFFILFWPISHSPIIPERSVWVSLTGIVVASVPFFSFIYGVTFGKYNYKVHRTTLAFDDLPEEFNNFTIAQISDIHAGSFNDPNAIKKGIKLLNAQKPDLFVFTGDLVNNKASEIVPFLDIFKQVTAPYGRFSILGNHDYGDYVAWNSEEEKRLNLEQLKQYHEQLGYRLLMDEHVWIKKGNQQIALMGVENWGKGFGQRGNLNNALLGVDNSAFKVLLSHDPSHWDEEIKQNPVKIHLTLSGHTHGMQFGIEIGRFKWSPVKYRYPNWAGLVKENGKFLYVNRGFGFLGFAGRVGIWPEITIITLKKSN